MTTLTQPVPLRPLPLPGRRAWRSVESLERPDEYTQGALALSYPLDTGTPGGGNVEAWAAAFVQAVVEVIGCNRPVTQLIRWTSRSVYAEIVHRQRQVSRHRSSTAVRAGRQQVATVRVFRPEATCAEVAARVSFDTRSRAIAARLDLVNGRWLCTAIQLG